MSIKIEDMSRDVSQSGSALYSLLYAFIIARSAHLKEAEKQKAKVFLNGKTKEPRIFAHKKI